MSDLISVNGTFVNQPFTKANLQPTILPAPSPKQTAQSTRILTEECPRCLYFWQHKAYESQELRSCEIGPALWKRHVMHKSTESWPAIIADLEDAGHCTSFTAPFNKRGKTATRKD